MTFPLGGRGALLLLVWMALMRCADPTQSCNITAQPDFISLAHRPLLPLRRTESSLMYNFSRSFLNAVQPNAFPTDIMLRVLEEEEQDVSEVARYEAGYLVCLILALLYLALVPVLGGVFAWRHYHGNGGGISLSQPFSRRHWGIAMATCLAATTILLLAGVILAFTTNSRAKENMKPGLYHLRSSLGDMGKALSSIPEKMDLILQQYSVPKAQIEKHLNGVGEDIGQAVIAASDTQAKEAALADLSVSARDAVRARENLQVIETLRALLQERQLQLEAQLAELRQGLEETQTACPACSFPSTNQLRTDADYNKAPSVQPQLDRFPPAAQYTGLVQQANASFSGIPQILKRQTATSIKVLVADLEKSGTSLNGSSQQFPSLHSITEKVSDFRRVITVYGEDINRYEYQRWAVAVVFCTLILFIAVLTAVGLGLGLPALCCPDFSPAHSQDQLTSIAVTLLRVAVALTLIFSWLFIILVFITLFFGGNVHSLGCRSWESGEIFEFFDQYDDLLSSLRTNQSEANSASPLNLSTAEIYSGCKTGRSLFHSMEFTKLFDLDNFVNASKYMVGFRQNVHNMSINLEDFQLLPPAGIQTVLRFRDSGIDTVSYAAFAILLTRPVMRTNLTVLAEELDTAAQKQKDERMRKDLENKARKAREVNELAQQQERDAKKMDASVIALSLIRVYFKANINKALRSIGRVQQGLQKLVPSIVGNVSQCILHKGEMYLERYLDWVRHTIVHEVLECQWLPVSLENVHTALCEHILPPWNGFWLCLGWCCVFLVPTVIFSLFTANLLQPAKPHLPSSAEDKPSKPEEKTGHTELNNYVTIKGISDLSY